MTRPHCPKCQKYYVTLIPEQRRLPARTIAAVARLILRTPSPVSPYHRYQCDICGHRWAVLVASITSAPATPTVATHTTLAASIFPARVLEGSRPLSARATARANTTGVLTAQRTAVHAASYSVSWPGAMAATRWVDDPTVAYSAAPDRVDEMDEMAELADDEPTRPRRTLTQGGASSAHYARRNPPMPVDRAGLAARDTGKLARGRLPRWQDVWRSFLPFREPESVELDPDVAS